MADDALRELLTETYGNPVVRNPADFAHPDPFYFPQARPPPAEMWAPGARPASATAPVEQTLADNAAGMMYGVPHDVAQAVDDVLNKHWKDAAAGAATLGAQLITPPGLKGARPPRLPELRAVPGQTVTKPYRAPLYEGIYKNPKDMVAEVQIEPESKNLKDVFNVTRNDLYGIGQQGGRKGNLDTDEFMTMADKPRGAASAEKVMNPRNEQRLNDILYEAGKVPGLRIGMDSWYVMDPMYWELEKMFGPEEAIKRYNHLNAMIGMASPGTNVVDEIKRGTLAHYLEQQGRFGDFYRHGGLMLPDPKYPNAPTLADIGVYGVPGHTYHSSSQAGPMRRYLEAGREIQSDQPKVPSYVAASGVPAGGFQTHIPVGDAHWSRAVGLADARHGPTDITASASRQEIQSLAPWWRDKIMPDLEGVPKQARLWGAVSKQTGVDTAVGAPKLELIANHIVRRAQELGIPVEEAKRRILSGEMYALGGGVY